MAQGAYGLVAKERPISTTWNRVSPELARTHPLYGLGGWTALLICGLVFSLLLAWAPAGELKSQIYAEAHRVASAQGLSIDEAEAAVRAIPAVSNWVTAFDFYAGIGDVLIITCLILLIRRQRSFAACYTALWAVGCAASLYIMMIMPSVSLPQLVGTAIPALLAAVLWVAYVWRSRRIRVTTRNEVRSDDPFLRQLDPVAVPVPSAEPRMPSVVDATPAILKSDESIDTGSTESAESREKGIYSRISAELDTGAIDKPVWTKAYAEADGNLERTRAAYIRYRAEELRAPQPKSSHAELREGKKETPASETQSIGDQLEPWLAIHGLQAPEQRADLDRAASPANEISQYSGLKDPYPAYLRSDEIERTLKLHEATPQEEQRQLARGGKTRQLARVAFVLVVATSLLLLATVNPTSRREPSTAAQRASPPEQRASPPDQPAPLQASIERRVSEYASTYKLPTPLPNDEAMLTAVNANAEVLSFQYELTPFGLRQLKARRLADDSELSKRMIEIMCGDPTRRQLLLDGAHLASVVHLGGQRDVVAWVSGAGECK